VRETSDRWGRLQGLSPPQQTPFRFRPDNASNHGSVFRGCPDEMDAGNDLFQAQFDPEWDRVRVSDVGPQLRVARRSRCQPMYPVQTGGRWCYDPEFWHAALSGGQPLYRSAVGRASSMSQHLLSTDNGLQDGSQLRYPAAEWEA
jgi:hypothetical protein